MNQRKRLMTSIDSLDNKLRKEQSKLIGYKRSLLGLFYEDRWTTLSTLLAAFIAGWKSGQVSGPLQKIKKFSKFMVLAFISHIKQRP